MHMYNICVSISVCVLISLYGFYTTEPGMCPAPLPGQRHGDPEEGRQGPEQIDADLGRVPPSGAWLGK